MKREFADKIAQRPVIASAHINYNLWRNIHHVKNTLYGL